MPVREAFLYTYRVHTAYISSSTYLVEDDGTGVPYTGTVWHGDGGQRFERTPVYIYMYI